MDAQKVVSPAKKSRLDPERQNQEREEFMEAEKKCPYEVVTRSKKEMTALCDERGEFTCCGVWNQDKCAYEEDHKINPYRSKEELVLFSTWNLDHKYESFDKKIINSRKKSLYTRGVSWTLQRKRIFLLNSRY